MWFFLISPVILPEHIKQKNITISFLGSILEKVEIAGDHLQSIRNIAGVSLPQNIQNTFEDVEKEPSKEQLSVIKDRYEEGFCSFGRKNESQTIRFHDFLVKGEAKNRLILYKPEISKISVLPSDFRSYYTITLRFKISRHGLIKDPECLISSGSPEIDKLAISYIRKWQFVPGRDGEEGIVRLSFNTQ